MTADLRRRGWLANHKHMLRLMRLDGLLCRPRRCFASTTDSGHSLPVFRNLARHHSDCGVQYASADYVSLLVKHQIRISMSRTGNPYDNARAERFMRTLKHEEVSFICYQNLTETRGSIRRFGPGFTIASGFTRLLAIYRLLSSNTAFVNQLIPNCLSHFRGSLQVTLKVVFWSRIWAFRSQVKAQYVA